MSSAAYGRKKRYASSQKSRHVARVQSAHLEQLRHIAPSPYWTALRELSARSSSSCAHSEENSANATLHSRLSWLTVPVCARGIIQAHLVCLVYVMIAVCHI